MIRRPALFFLFLLPLMGAAGFAVAAPPEQPEQPEQIVADVSSRNIAITVGFSGADTTLFGALPENGDVIVTVAGPPGEAVVRRKERILGVWLNRGSAHFDQVPGFYWIATSRPLAGIVPEAWLAAQRIGIDHLRFTVTDASDYRQIDIFLQALVDLKVKDRLFFSTPAPVSIMGGRLYRADVHIPADAPTGSYTLTTYLLRNGELVGREETILTLRKEGAMAEVSVIAERNSLGYALLALTLAVLAGWSSAMLTRRS